jgi:hypothetical protein
MTAVLFFLVFFTWIYSAASEKTITAKEFHRMIVSGEIVMDPDKNSTEANRRNEITKIESKIWLIEDKYRQAIEAMKADIDALSQAVHILDARGCSCEVICSTKTAKDIFEDIEYSLDDIESRVYDIESKLEI